jgi:hypothetical protein
MDRLFSAPTIASMVLGAELRCRGNCDGARNDEERLEEHGVDNLFLKTNRAH